MGRWKLIPRLCLLCDCFFCTLGNRRARRGMAARAIGPALVRHPADGVGEDSGHRRVTSLSILCFELKSRIMQLNAWKCQGCSPLLQFHDNHHHHHLAPHTHAVCIHWRILAGQLSLLMPNGPLFSSTTCLPPLLLFFGRCSHQGPKPKMLSSGKNLLNLASTNFLGYINNEDIKVSSFFLVVRVCARYLRIRLNMVPEGNIDRPSVSSGTQFSVLHFLCR
jgi:hypothetical protein